METTLKDKIDALRQLLDSAEADVLKSDDGVRAAGARARKSLQELKKMAQEARVFCLQRDQARKVAK